MKNKINKKLENLITCSLFLSRNVEGSIVGNIFNKKGSKSSMKGTITMTINGTSRKISAIVRFN